MANIKTLVASATTFAFWWPSDDAESNLSIGGGPLLGEHQFVTITPEGVIDVITQGECQPCFYQQVHPYLLIDGPKGENAREFLRTVKF